MLIIVGTTIALVAVASMLFVGCLPSSRQPCDDWPGGKPCPKCKQHPHLRPWHDPFARGGDDTRFRVECPTCGHVGPNKVKTPEQAVNEWNDAANAESEVSE